MEMEFSGIAPSPHPRRFLQPVHTDNEICRSHVEVEDVDLTTEEHPEVDMTHNMPIQAGYLNVESSCIAFRRRYVELDVKRKTLSIFKSDDARIPLEIISTIGYEFEYELIAGKQALFILTHRNQLGDDVIIRRFKMTDNDSVQGKSWINSFLVAVTFDFDDFDY